jgi:hypothetical protein
MMAVYEPKITAVAITPNPVDINTSFKITVAATEVEVVMYRVGKISGAAISGEGTNPAVKFEEVS